MPDVEITSEMIKSAVSRRLIEAVPAAAGRVYKEPQHQNINGDAFYIQQRRVSQSPQFMKLLTRRYEMIIRYEPDIEAGRQLEKCTDMGSLLMFELRAIDPGNGVLIRGNDMSYEIVDNVALVYVTYPVRMLVDLESQTFMNELTINREV
jgi:hypothetical protein